MARSKQSEEYAKNRKCNWATVVYPTKEFYYKYLKDHDLVDHFRENDNCPIDKDGKELYNGSDGWGEFGEKEYNTLLDALVPCCISPLHYLDIDDQEEGNPYKKPHFHILCIYETVKSYEQAKSFFDTFKGVGAKPIDSRRGAARYLCHLDHPHKAQYDKSLVFCTGGLNYYDLINSVTDCNSEVANMIDFIVENHIFSFSQFLRYCKSNNSEWFNILCNSKSYIVDKFIKGYTWELENAYRLDELEKSADKYNN